MDFSNDYVEHKKEKINYIQFRRLNDFKKDLVHAYTIDKKFSFRTDMNNKKRPLDRDEYNQAVVNYQELCQVLNIDYKNLVKVNQEHTLNIKIIKNKVNQEEPDFNVLDYQDCDGMVTNQKNLFLTTVSADCVIILMFDPVKKVVANIHAGWRGSLGEIGCLGIKIMQESFGSNLQDIIVALNPAIGGDVFLVDEEVKNLFWEKFKSLANIKEIIKEKENAKWTIDLVLLNKTLLILRGIKEENIVVSGICTFKNSKYMHSYRADGIECGLNTAIIGLI